MTTQDAQIVLITGANTGIGWEAVKALLQSDRKYLVLMGSRSLEKAADAIKKVQQEVPGSASTVEPVQVDISSDDSIQAAYDAVKQKYGRLDTLVNNAGGQYETEARQGKCTMREAFNKNFDINVSGTYVMTQTFMPLLLKSTSGGRLLFITSGLSSLSKYSAQPYPAPQPPVGEGRWPKEELDRFSDAMPYRTTKTALNMMMLNFAWQLTNDSVKVWAISPGFLATGLGGQADMLKQRGAGHPSVGGKFIRDVVEGKRDADVGKVVHSDGSVQPW
ncbi:retinol dehydrogenase 14 [Microdochium nivale]|nr:retinol dehydrogenase 14 [Microdochium nivale]